MHKTKLSEQIFDHKKTIMAWIKEVQEDLKRSIIPEAQILDMVIFQSRIENENWKGFKSRELQRLVDPGWMNKGSSKANV